MRITLLAHGSRGDVQPYLALALGLVRAGHTVRLAAPGLFRPWIEAYAEVANQPQSREERPPTRSTGQLLFTPLPGDPTRLMQTAASTSPWMRLVPSPIRMGLTVAGSIAPVVSQLTLDIRAACQEADLVIHSLVTTVLGHQVAHELGVPDLSALIFPVFTRTQAFPNPLFPAYPGWARWFGKTAAGFGPRYNDLTHREFNRVFWQSNRLAIQYIRRRSPGLLAPLNEWPFEHPDAMGSNADSRRPTPILYGISTHALPCPAEWKIDHPGCDQMTGFWFLDALTHGQNAWQPPVALTHFLEAGPPPVCVSFGSMIPRDMPKITRTVLAALEMAGQRGLLLGGWGNLAGQNPSGSIYCMPEAPFDWLFPRVSAAIHHGGVGTSASALRAGIPSVTVPFAFDQPFWGRQIHTLGAGASPISREQLTPERLAQAIQITKDPAVRARAAALGRQIRAEDGVEKAVAVINHYYG